MDIPCMSHPPARLRIPETLQEATSASWLSTVLGTEVTGVFPGEVDDRVSTNMPLRVELADGSSRDLWVKGYFTELGRQYRFGGVAEAAFYRDLVDRTGVRTLRPVAAVVDFDSHENVIVTEDELGTGARFLHALDDFTPDHAARSLEQLAILHATTWLDPALRDTSWLANRCSRYTVTRGVEEIRTNLDGPIGAGVPDAVRDATRLFDAYRVLGDRIDSATPWSVIHGDPHIGNVCVDGAGHPFLVDWQLVQRGPWYIDVGYHLAAVLTVEDRRRAESDLLQHYLEQLGTRGIQIPARDVWPGVRLGMLHGFYLWAITLKVDPRKTAVLLERLGTAVADHDAFDEIEA
jgi:hypothetical protein